MRLGRRDQLVHPLAVHGRGPRLRPARGGDRQSASSSSVRQVIVDPLENNFNLINSGAHDRLRQPRARPAVRGDGRLGDGQRADAASLPPRFEPPEYLRRSRRCRASQRCVVGIVVGGQVDCDPRRGRRRLRQLGRGRDRPGDRRHPRRLLPHGRRRGPGERVDRLDHRPHQEALPRPVLPLLHAYRVRPLQAGIEPLGGRASR